MCRYVARHKLHFKTAAAWILALLGSLGGITLAAGATVVYQTDFGYANYQTGVMAGQDGWFSATNYSQNAAQIVTILTGYLAQITGSLVQSNAPSFYNAEFLNTLSNYNPIAAGTPVVTVSADVSINLGPGASGASWLYGLLVLNDQNGNTYETIGVDQHGNVFGQNVASPNQIASAGLSATNGFHNLRADLNFTNRQIIFYLDGHSFGVMPFNTNASNQLGSVGLILQSSNPLDSTMFVEDVSVTASTNVPTNACSLTIASVGPCLNDGTYGTPSIGDYYGLKVVVNVTGTTVNPFRIKWTMANATYYFDNITLGPGNGYYWWILFSMDLDDPIPWSVTLDPDGVSGNSNLISNTASGVFTPIPPATPVETYSPRVMHGSESYSLDFQPTGGTNALYVVFGSPTSHGAQNVVSTTGSTNGAVVVTPPYGVPVFEIARTNAPTATYSDTNTFTVQLNRFRANATLLRTNTWASLSTMTTNWTQWIAPDARNESTSPIISNFVQQALPAKYQSILTPYDTARILHKLVMKTLTYQSPPNHIDAIGVLQDGVADCGGYAALLTSCLRNVGIPARCISGFREGDSVWHIRTEFHLPGVSWIVADACDGNSVDPTGSYACYFANLENADSFFAMDVGDSHILPFYDFEFIQVPNYLQYGSAYSYNYTFASYLGLNGALSLTNPAPGSINFCLTDVPYEGSVIVQESTNLRTWSPVATNASGGTTLNYSFPTTNKAQFFRVTVSP